MSTKQLRRNSVQVILHKNLLLFNFCYNKQFVLFEVAAVDVETIQDGPVGHGTHAMVLDTIKDGKFVFKNTYADNKQVEIPVDKGPLEFYFVHMELNDDALEELRTRKENQSSDEDQSSSEN